MSILNDSSKELCCTEGCGGDWYCIPISEKDNFYKWVIAMENGDESEFDYDEFRLQMHITNYSFKNLKELF
jgi:hypothetical protein